MGGKGSGIHATGRKRKSQEGRISFSVSCSKEQREAIKKLAEKKAVTVSELIINSLLNEE